jgi:hypothetical protein
MSGYSRLYVVGELGGFMGADGVNPILFQILIGDADRQWLEVHYFDKFVKPIGNLSVIVPAGPDDPEVLLDACIAFFPDRFRSCPSLAAVEQALQNAERLDFNMGKDDIPAAWGDLREEARPLFRALNVWQADFVPMQL